MKVLHDTMPFNALKIGERFRVLYQRKPHRWHESHKMPPAEGVFEKSGATVSFNVKTGQDAIFGLTDTVLKV